MKIKFAPTAKKQYLYWVEKDKKKLNQINKLIKAIQEDPYNRIGKPEALKYSLTGYWSRRINHEHRLVYKVEDDILYILQCRYHY